MVATKLSNLRSPERFRVAGAEHGDAYRGQCMKCGVCTIRCPTFELLRDERDGPRGRVAMAIELLESKGPPKPETVRHLDRCLSCLACSNTCPFGVDHTHLWDKAKARIEQTYKRPLHERLLRRMLATVLPNPRLFRVSLRMARMGRPFAALLPRRLRGMIEMAPSRIPVPSARETGVFPASVQRKRRVALLAGCAQKVLRPSLNSSTIRFFTRHGIEVVVPAEAGCCGALVLHMGRPEEARGYAKRNIEAWEALMADGGIDAIAINASGCGTTLKTYAELFADDPVWRPRAERISRLAQDVSEIAAGLPLAPAIRSTGARVAYHNPCSLNNGQGIALAPVQLLQKAGFKVVPTPAGPACCGSAGTYNMLQPEISAELGKRKAAALESAKPSVIATGNIGCQVQISRYGTVPVVHTIELLDWATGGPAPQGLHESALA